MPTAINTTEAANTFEFAGQDIPRLVARWAQQRPDHAFMIWEPHDGNSKTWTYQRFEQDMCRVAAGLLARGVVKGEKVMIHCDNCPEAVLAWYACAKIGAIAGFRTVHEVVTTSGDTGIATCGDPRRRIADR